MTPRASSAPPSSASGGAASSPAPASAADFASSTARPHDGRRDQPPPPRLLRRPLRPHVPLLPGRRQAPRLAAASSSTPCRGGSSPGITLYSSGIPSPTSSWTCPAVGSGPIRVGLEWGRCSAPQAVAAATTSTAAAAPSSWSSWESAAGRHSPASTRRKMGNEASPPMLPTLTTVCLECAPAALVGNAPYFMFIKPATVLKYDLTTREMTMIHLPLTTYPRPIVLMTTEDGGLGLAGAEDFRLYLWSREAGADDEARWAQSRVIELETLLPVDALSASPIVVGFADGVGVIFLWATEGLFSIDLKSSQVRKVPEGRGVPDVVVPYMSFYTPALAAAGLYRQGTKS